MSIKCNLEFSEFHKLISPMMQAEQCPIKMAIGEQAKKIPAGPNTTAKLQPADWCGWLKAAPFDEEVIWNVDKAGFVYTLKSKGSGSSRTAAAIYYRLHYHMIDLSFATEVDKLVFGGAYKEKAGVPIFEDIGDAPDLRIPESANPLHFSNRVVDRLGRVEQYKTLQRFLTQRDQPDFRWVQLAGAGGQGKSRLAHDLVIECQSDWHAGFLGETELADFAPFWDDWNPRRPTLIVVDYVLGQEGQVKVALQSLARKGRAFAKPVRLILIERQRWDRGWLDRPVVANTTGEISIDNLQPSSGRASWFLSLCNQTDGFDFAIADTRFDVGNGVIELAQLTPEELFDLTKQLTLKAGVPVSEGWVKDTLARIDSSGRPLFAYFLASAIADGAIGDGHSIETEEEFFWSRELLLDYVLDRERDHRWLPELGDEALKLEKDGPVMRLALLATMIGGFDYKRMKSRLPTDWRRPNERELIAANVIVGGPRGRATSFAGLLPPFQPDTLGEWFVLSSLKSGVIDPQMLAELAWRIAPDKMATFLQRCTEDFPLLYETSELLNVVPPDADAQLAYGAACTTLFANLHRSRIKEYPEELLNQIQIAANHGCDRKATGVLGFCKLTGTAIERDVDGGIHLVKAAAEAGDSSAKLNLGDCFQRGIGVDINPAEAVKLYWEAANAGETRALVNLGYCYENGVGVEPDPIKARQYYLNAAEDGDTRGMVNLAVCIEEVGTNLERAIEWYSKAAGMGDVNAMVNLGRCYQDGVGVKKNAHEATIWYRRAAIRGDNMAMLALGCCYLNEIGLEADPKEAMKWFQRAAANRSSIAMFNLGTYELEGSGGEIDEQQAFNWYAKSADFGYTEAMFNLGMCYLGGIGVGTNIEEGIKWLRRAARAKNTMAMTNLGLCHQLGIGVAADLQQAFKYYETAALAGDLRGIFNFAFCLERGNGTDPDPRKAVEWYTKSAELGDIDSMFNLGICYEKGIGTKRDPHLSKYWFQQAKRSGHIGATIALTYRPSTNLGDQEERAASEQDK